MFKACLFDLDGVLVDTAKYHYVAWKRLAESLGVPFNEHDNEPLKGVSRADSLAYILHKGNISATASEKQQWMDTKNDWYLELISNMRKEELLPNAASFLAELKTKGIRIGLGSSSKNAQLILDKTGIFPLFDTVVDGRHTTYSKPNPEVFIKGAQQLQCSPSETVVFEDAISGIDAALAGGFFAIGLGDPTTLTKAHVVIPSLEKFSVQQLVDLPIFR